MSLRQDFGNDFSASAFQTIDGEPQIVGKFGRITQFPGGTFDCWFVDPNRGPLSGRRLAAINRAINGGIIQLTGEGYIQGAGRQFVIDMAQIIRVRKRRKLSIATVRQQSERLRKHQFA